MKAQSVSQPFCYDKPTVKDFIALTKPKISVLCVFEALGGIALAPHSASFLSVVFLCLGVYASVASANVLNMALEYKTDALMHRTKLRPIATGKINVNHAWIFGFGLAIVSTLILALTANILTALLSLWAIIAYAFVYTPLKYLSPTALIIGAFPGAMPPLLGWTSVENNLALPGLLLFGILFLWQIPHFIAISIFNADDYSRAGIRTISQTQGVVYAKFEASVFSLLLLFVSIGLFAVGSAGQLYVWGAIIFGITFLFFALKGFFAKNEVRWSRQLFFGSLLYLPALTVILAIDRIFLGN